MLKSKLSKICIIYLTRIIALIIGISIFTIPVSAEEVSNYRFINELQQVTTYNQNGLPVIDIDKAYLLELSDEAVSVGIAINDIVADVEQNGEKIAIKNMDRAIFPIGSYGNFCGMGNNGWLTKPIDNLDSACLWHDACFKGFGADNRQCNREFINRLKPIIASTNTSSYKGVYARAAYALFLPLS